MTESNSDFVVTVGGDGIDAPLPTPSVIDRGTTVQWSPRTTNASVLKSDGVLGTASTLYGGPVVGDLKGTDLVSVKGVQMQVENAVRMGYLRKTADGYADVGAEDHPDHLHAQQQAEEQEAEEADRQPVQIDDETHAEVNDFHLALKEIGVSPTQALAELLNDPTKLPSHFEVLAELRGFNPTDVHQALKTTYAKVEQHIGGWLHEQGVSDPKGFFDYINAHKGRNTVNAALSQTILYGQTEPLRDMVEMYKRMSNQETPVRRSSGGQAAADDRISINGITTTRAAAKRLGWIG